MKIADIGGEFELIKKLTSGKKLGKDIIKGIGDDCAVIEISKDKYTLVTTDMMVENDHFSLEYFEPKQIGMKLMESNVSDIISMGGKPKFAFVSMSLTKDTTVELIEGIYEGLYESAEKHGVSIIGGDTTHGSEIVLNLTLIGETTKEKLTLRSGAKVGDLICVTGKLGGSTSGLKLLLKKIEGDTSDHLNPKSRTFEEGQKIAKFANSMIDVSDGLGSEVQHICNESNTGAIINWEKIPIKEVTIVDAKKINQNPYDFALYGGEDFELVFTIAKDKINFLKKIFKDFTIVGHIAPIEKGVWLLKDNEKLKLKKGYNHFT